MQGEDKLTCTNLHGDPAKRLKVLIGDGLDNGVHPLGDNVLGAERQQVTRLHTRAHARRAAGALLVVTYLVECWCFLHHME